MGYSREQAIGALRQSNWDVDQALDHLEGGDEEFEDDEEVTDSLIREEKLERTV